MFMEIYLIAYSPKSSSMAFSKNFVENAKMDIYSIIPPFNVESSDVDNGQKEDYFKK